MGGGMGRGAVLLRLRQADLSKKIQKSYIVSDQSSCLGEVGTSQLPQSCPERFRPESPRKDTLQPAELPAGCAQAPGSQPGEPPPMLG